MQHNQVIYMHMNLTANNRYACVRTSSAIISSCMPMSAYDLQCKQQTLSCNYWLLSHQPFV